MKYEFNFIDAMGKATGMVTDQFEVENGELYDINFIEEDGKKKHPIILHLSPSGAIERDMYALLEKAWMEEQKDKAAMLPVWLSPEQIRIMPVADRHMEHAEKIAKELEAANIRVGVDDRSIGVGKKVFQAKMAWVPYIIVIGDKEAAATKLPVVIRAKSKPKEDTQEEMSVKDIINEISGLTHGKPTGLLPVAKYVSKRPIFVARQ
ncbi:MAG: His/Gly/Thr/Pro-type tRNA ligase C-terminal domain-containing protein [Candidatus Nanoarchaeia archaeon]|nr:His/Gly/Thr/Pro-type tRNA ligase C-terminal domain-containing protein [Candidatus Nanoarchaeia archaeon]